MEQPEITGEKLKELRKKAKLTLVDVAKTGIVSSSYLSQVENNLTISPSFTIMMKLLELYNVKVDITL